MNIQDMDISSSSFYSGRQYDTFRINLTVTQKEDAALFAICKLVDQLDEPLVRNFNQGWCK